LLFAIWVLFPFAAISAAIVFSKRWSLLARGILHTATLVLSMVPLLVYGKFALQPARQQPAFAFVVLPPILCVGTAVVVSLAALVTGRLSKNRLAHCFFKGFALLVMLSVFGCMALLGALWLERRSKLTLPNPTGSFAVGREIYDWTDEAHPDPLAPVSGTRREVLVWMWYPSTPARSVVPDDYVPRQLPAEGAPPDSFVFRLLTRDLSKVRAHSIPNADMSSSERTYPVVIMRTGASAEVMNYTTLAEDLASHGYIVVGFDAPYRTGRVVFPDGRVIARTPENNPELLENQPQAARLNELLNTWTSDIGFVLDRLEQLNTSDPSGKFTGRLDLAQVGVFGHSFGGAQAAQFCSQDSRCKAGVDVDGRPLGSAVQTGLHQPFMFLLSDQNTSDAEGRQVMADIQSIYDRLPANGRLLVKIRGANHFFFSDDAALLKSHLLLGVLRKLGFVHIDGRRQLEVTAFCLRSFFDAYLKGTNASQINISSSLCPEVQVLN
jgi:predicted dienelactone hydrolase